MSDVGPLIENLIILRDSGDFSREERAQLDAACKALSENKDSRTPAQEGMREALLELNAELDAYWNDETQAGKRPPESYIQRITIAQAKCYAALSVPAEPAGRELLEALKIVQAFCWRGDVPPGDVAAALSKLRTALGEK